jgi:diketogulonate reductase-like aldo/keto reductase
MPNIYIGTFEMSSSEAERTVYEAIKIGYRHIDTAQFYQNQVGIANAIKRAIKENIVTRNQLVIQTKIAPKDSGREFIKPAIVTMLLELQVDYIDCVLMHWPGTQKIKAKDPRNKLLRIESVSELKKMKDLGFVREFGVSNYNVYHFEGIDENVDWNQFEFHFLRTGEVETMKLYDYCVANGIKMQGYCCLGKGLLLDPALYPELFEIATRLKATLAQVSIQYISHKGISPVVKASSVARLKENFDSSKFTLSEAEILLIDSIHKRSGNTKYCWDPILIK